MQYTRILLLISCQAVVYGVAGLPHSTGDELVRQQGRFISLTTDCVSQDEAKALVESFDSAVPQWAKFWQLPPDGFQDWSVDACLMRDRERFRREGMIPDHVPDFPFGYAWGNQVWVLVQPSGYYTRHLLLHEGVHAFAFAQFGGAGPTWFMEGTAELLATHRGSGASIEINRVPVTRESVPYWGRFKLMGQLREQSRVPKIEAVMRYGPNVAGSVEAYGWSWAAVMILDAYPEYRHVLREAARAGRDSSQGFNRALYRKVGQKHWPILAARWRVMCDELNYGFDWERQRVNLSPDDPVWQGERLSFEVAADRGWCSAGVRFAANSKLSLDPSGTITLADKPRPWKSEPSGVTIRYHRGKPLGQLLVCLLPTASQGDRVAPLKVMPVTRKTVVTVKQHCWLLARVNDAVGELGDNSGSYQCVIE